MQPREDRKAEHKPLRLLLWTALAGLIFGLIGFGEIAEDHLRTMRNRAHPTSASGDIILVKIDEESIRKVGRYPWSRTHYADLIDQLSNAGAKRIFVDLLFDTESDPAADRRFLRSLERSGRVILAVVPRSDNGSAELAESGLLSRLPPNAAKASISIPYNYQGAVWRMPYGLELNGEPIPSFAALLGGRRGEPGDFFIPDYSIDPASIPAISAASVLEGPFDEAQVRGKDIVIGATAELVNDIYFIPGTGRMGGAYVHVIGGETLKQGRPIYLGWLPLFLVALAAGAAALWARRPLYQNLLLGGATATCLLLPLPLEAALVTMDTTPALFVLVVLTVAIVRRHLRLRALVNTVSGLPNLNALQANKDGRSKALVCGRVHNFAEIVSTLAEQGERELVEQLVSRFRVGNPDRIIYQGDGGIFAWFEDPHAPFGHHLDALGALFRNSVKVDGLSIDLSISFGVEVGSSRSLANRLGSAMLAAEDAARHGLKWKYHDPDTLQDTAWKLSILSQLDAAIDKGEVWVAYQPQIDLRSGRIVAAEALARWTHPDKGPIAASEFVAAAEQHDRIGKLTRFVLEQAAAAAAKVQKRQCDFTIAVNLSARTLTDRGFPDQVAGILAAHDLEPGHLTLELTETSELAACGESLEMLLRLRELGVNISIDDYGTGLSTLDYLKKIPAGEIKIDQSFVRGMCDNRSDRLMVQSTIGLAHSLGRKVVAEGVEDRETLQVLAEIDCDLAQGFFVGRPMSLESLMKRVSGERRLSVA